MCKNWVTRVYPCYRKQTRRGGIRGRGRGMPKRRGPKPRQPSSLCTPTADDIDAAGTSTDGNAFPKRIMSPTSSSPPTKKRMDFNEERELSLPRLKPTVIPENSAILSSAYNKFFLKKIKSVFYYLQIISSF